MAIDKLNPRESLGFLAWKVARLIAGDLTARFTEAGVSVSVEQWRALIPVYKVDGLTQGRLCEILSQEKTGVSRLVAALEKRGLLVRVADEHDRRVKHLFITDEGRRLIEATADLAIENRLEVEKDIDPEDLAVCKRVLWDIIKPTLEIENCCSEKV
ncbi:MarR family transcriptional regulator [Pseudodesulfovibrio cashew]|uniref:MarR family transcriptional regulator n=1 Tax=Pseudodesulfovibrio cashew TaxID=2678688 RepID=A0A6I6JDG1_9BACT|nr:MarR family winged helix-turn-helix transcriptional regulator [Pseudodesulfovibrio cashew]QGY40161.1 MarR family transcriptional regulator [Pseudodesulfovibrio cashew]